MRVVVTGASGAVGRHVADRLIGRQNIEVIALDRASSDGVIQFELQTGDLTEYLRSGDSLVHLAATPAGFAGDGGAAKADRQLAERALDAATRALSLIHI